MLAVPEDAVARVNAAGLAAAPILPSFASICARLNASPADIAARVFADTAFVIDEILLPSLGASTAALDTIAAEADMMVGSIFAFAADIVAEKRRLPLVSVMLQPMALFSARQPPTAPELSMLRRDPRTSLGRGWNRAFLLLLRTMLRRRYARRIDAVRADHGLAPGRRAPILDRGPATAELLCCWSSVLGALPADAPGNAALVGFPFMDEDTGADAKYMLEIDGFMHAGDPPLVFTLGSFAVVAAGHFYAEAAAASRALGRRALMLTGQAGPPRGDGDCLFVDYAPHSAVFPDAAAVIHHGGIGTTAQALRAGRPQIVIPHFGDQFDNAARLQSIGVGLSISRDHFDRDRAASAISQLLATPGMNGAARRAADRIDSEDGAQAAADHILRLRNGRHGIDTLRKTRAAG